MTSTIYLDYAASTPIDERVVAAMMPFHGAANPSSLHVAGRRASDAVEVARDHVAALVGARPSEIVFTSGATEADNLAIAGVIRACGAGHVVTTAAEHKAVLETTRAWCPDAAVVPVRSDGSVDPASIEAAIRSDTVLVTVMSANNEVGTVSPLREIGEICHERGVLFHTDAAQAAGKMPLDVESLPVDLLSMSAHKMYGPKGVGALWIRRGVKERIAPLMLGGGHERGLRSGTVNVAGCVGFGEAARVAAEDMAADERSCIGLRRELIAEVGKRFDGAALNGKTAATNPGIVNLRLPQTDAESLLLATPGVAVSTGSACTSLAPAPSHVLLAMGLTHDAARESIRFSFGRFTTVDDIRDGIGALAASAELLRDTAKATA